MLEPPIGSDFYYALRFSPGSHEPLKCLWRLFQTFRSLHPPHLDETIAPVKLQWWRDEIGRTYSGKPEHPLTQALLPLIKTYDLKEKDFQTLLHAHVEELTSSHFEDWASMLQFVAHKNGSEVRLYAQLLSHNAINSDGDSSNYNALIPDAFSLNLGAMFFLIDKINYFGQDLSAGNLISPKSDLDFFKITPTELFNKQCSAEKVSALLLKQAEQAKHSYHTALEVLPESERYSQLPLLILAKMQLSLLTEIERDGFKVLHQSYRLTPLRQCWIAWRSYRTEKRRRSKWKSSH